MVRKAVFLDRDGVINRSLIVNGKPKAPINYKDFIFLPNSKKSINLLIKNNYLVFVVTNQPDIGNKKILISEINLMHDKIMQQTKIEKIFMCPHSQKKNCDCRKPKIKFLLFAKKNYNLDLSKSFVVGDRFTDIQMGINSGCRTIFINRSYKEEYPKNRDYEVKNILQAAQIIISKKS